MTDHVLRNGRFGEFEAELQQFSMNLRRAPERIRQAHLADEIDDVFRDAGSALRMATFPSPIEPESSLVPGDDGFRLDDHECGTPAIPEPRKPNPKQAVSNVQSELSPSIPSLKDQQLMPKRENLGVERDSRSETSPERRK